jgi:hypothetical protein
MAPPMNPSEATMAIKTAEQVILALAQWAALKEGTSAERVLRDINDEPKVREAFTKLVELAREGVRDAALEEAIAICDDTMGGRAVGEVAERIRALKGGG